MRLEGHRWSFARALSPNGTPLLINIPPLGLNNRELDVSGVYRVPAASMAKQTTESGQGSPDVQLVYGGETRGSSSQHTCAASSLSIHSSFGPAPLFQTLSTHTPWHAGLKRPNGLAFSPDFKTLYVANSDADDPKWIALDMDPQTGLPRAGSEPRQFASAKAFQKEDGSRIGNP